MTEGAVSTVFPNSPKNTRLQRCEDNTGGEKQLKYNLLNFNTKKDVY